jgi:hypothetical protein
MKNASGDESSEGIGLKTKRIREVMYVLARGFWSQKLTIVCIVYSILSHIHKCIAILQLPSAETHTHRVRY